MRSAAAGWSAPCPCDHCRSTSRSVADLVAATLVGEEDDEPAIEALSALWALGTREVFDAASSVATSSGRRRRPVQLALPMRTWGGARRGAGRKPKGERAGVSHLRRPLHRARFPVHVTLRMLPHVWNLRSRRSFRVFARAIAAAAERFGMRVCAFSVQGNHLHLIVEATDRAALSRGMKGLGVRLAKGLNRLMGRRGAVLADRYHEHALRTPAEVRRAVHYVTHNHAKHVAERGGRLDAGYLDPYSSASTEQRIPLPAPRTWLLTRHAPAPEARARDRT